MKHENIIANMMAIYAILLSVCVAIYSLIDISNIDRALASNLLIWSATLFAPIAFLYGLRYWKIQSKHEEKLKRLRNLKGIFVKFYILINDFRRNEKAYLLIKNNRNHVYKKKLQEFKNSYEKLSLEFFFYLNEGEEFFTKRELELLHDKLNQIYKVVVAFENSHLIVETIFLKLPRLGILKGASFELEMNLHLLDPGCMALRSILKNLKAKECLEGFEKIALEPLDDLGNNLSNIIRTSYE